MAIPKITILTATYNAGKTLERTILSVINQDYSNWEYIIVDGMSGDNTHSILEKYEDRISKVIIEKDRGLYDALNKGIAAASGDFLIVLGADDIFVSDSTLSRISKKLIDPECNYYGNVYYGDSGIVRGCRYSKLRWCLYNVCHQGIFYSKQSYKTQAYNLKYRIFADYAYNLSLIAAGRRFVYIDEVITLYNTGGLSSNSVDSEFAADKKKFAIEAFGFIGYFYSLVSCVKGLIIHIIAKIIGR